MRTLTEMHSESMNKIKSFRLVLATALISGCSMVGCKPALNDLPQLKTFFLQDSLFMVQVSTPKDIDSYSCYQLTFSHIDNYECQGAMGGDIWIGASSRKERAARHQLDYSEYFEKDEDINGIPFSMVAYKMGLGKDSKYPIVFISAITLIDNIPIRVTGECLGSDCEDFISRMEKVIRTVKITKLK